MSLVPMGGNKISINPWLMEHYPDSYLSMGLTAERVAQHYGIAREQADQFALASHQKALAAQAAGRFDEEIVPVPVTFTAPDGKSKLEDDRDRVQGGRRAARRHVAGGAGQAQAGVSCQRHRDRGQLLADFGRRGRGGGDVRGARAGAGHQAAGALGGLSPTPDACRRRWAIGPVYAIPKALKLAGLSLDQIDLIELNEAFAAQALAVIKTAGARPGEGECERRRHRAGASAGLHRRQADRHPAAGDEAAQGASTAW